MSRDVNKYSVRANELMNEFALSMEAKSAQKKCAIVCCDVILRTEYPGSHIYNEWVEIKKEIEKL